MTAPPDPLRPLRRLAALAWAPSVLAFLLLWAEDRAVVLHPWGGPLLVLFAVALLASLGGLARGVVRLLRGPRRGPALAWTSFTLLPCGMWAALGGYAAAEAARGNSPRNLPFRLAAVAAASLMEVQAGHAYPHRLESERLVMFYGDGVAEPEADLEAMERHVARLEALTGTPLRGKIHWVRGGLLGRGRMALCGLALGSERGPAAWDAKRDGGWPSLDQHELAHAVLHQRYKPETDPPTLLVEGWAESQSGPDAPRLARRALDSRAFRRRSLRALVGPDWYHRIGAPSYDVGGAFVDFLLRRHGVAPCLELYFGCTEETFPEDVRRVYGRDLEALEEEFWAEAERLAGGLTRPGR